MARSVLLVMLAMMMLSGCADVAPEGLQEAPPESPGGDTGQTGDGSLGTQSGKVTVSKQGDRWKAMRTEVGDLAFSAGQDIDASTVNGAVTLNEGGRGSAHIAATLWAYGDTEQQARQGLQTLSLRLSGPGVEAHVKASDNQWSNKGGNLAINVPVVDVDAVTLSTTNGAVTIDDLEATVAEIDTTNGAVECRFTSKKLVVETTNGAVTCSGTFNDVIIDTTNARIALDIKAAASGKWSIDSTNAIVDLTVVEDSQRGYDVQAQTTNGQIDFDFRETEEVDSSSGYVSKSRHERTESYGSRAIQTSVSIDTTNGAIEAGS